MRSFPLLLALTLALACAPATAAEIPDSCSLNALAANPSSCDAEIDRASDSQKPLLLQRRAYMLNEKGRIQEALRDLDSALNLDPDLPDALHERAYTRAETGDLAGALLDSNREVALRPDHPEAYDERAFIRRSQGDLRGAYEDRARALALTPDSIGRMTSKADAALWIGRFDEAAAQAEAALRLARDKGDDADVREAEAQREVVSLWRTPSGASPGKRCANGFNTAKVEEPKLIGDCTAAFFQSSDRAKKAEYLTYRSVMWPVVRQGRGRMLADAEVAVSLDSANPDLHVNVGGAYNGVGRFRAALRAFDRALTMRESFAGLAGRATARYALEDARGAFADAKRSFEIRPNTIALTVLGHLSHDRGDDKSAKLYWMGAYHLGSRDDGLIASLKSIGVGHPEREARAR
ncbi:MAG TPA: tetratricopeptide repeat protein [Allosphingosinicella sp.]|jgi:tetratricopeptide (TPR) repeat protein